MNIQHESNDERGRFFIEENGKGLAEMDYKLHNGEMVIVHTEVNESLEGKGVGKALVNAGVDYAREQKLMIKPLCQFAKKVMERSSDYADVLQKS
jgi:predicted GNAT family acetyltransferase